MWLYNVYEKGSQWIDQADLSNDLILYNKLINLFFDLCTHPDSSLISAYRELAPLNNAVSPELTELQPLLRLKPGFSIIKAMSTHIHDPLAECGNEVIKNEITQGLTLLKKQDDKLKHNGVDKHILMHQVRKMYEFAVDKSIRENQNHVDSLANLQEDPKYSSLKEHRSLWGNFCQFFAKAIAALKSLCCNEADYKNQFCFFHPKSIKTINEAQDQCSYVRSLMEL